jgi:hypothetical protein
MSATPPLPSQPAKPLDAINKKATVWVAIGTGLATIIAIPQVQQGLIYIIQHPTLQGVGAAAGTIITGLLLYFAHPIGTSSSPSP